MSTRTLPPRSEAVGQPKLVFRSGPCRGKVLLIDKNRISFGREDGNDVVIDNDIVSSEHAVLTLDADAGGAGSGVRVRLRDLESKNGTFVNGRRIDEVELAEGDVLWLCERGQEIEFTFGEPELPSILATSTATFRRTRSIGSALREVLPLGSRRGLVSVSGIRELFAGTLEESSRRTRRAILLAVVGVGSALILGLVALGAIIAGRHDHPDASGGGPGASVAGVTGNETTQGKRWSVRVSLDVEPIYSSLFHSYRVEGFGEVTVENRGDSELRGASLSVEFAGEAKSLLAEAMRFEIPALAPGKGWRSSLHPVLSGEVVTDRSREVTCVARVMLGGEEIHQLDRAVTIHDYHAFSWEPPEKVTVFIDSNDPAVLAFVDAAWSKRPESATTDGDFPPGKVVDAVTLLSAVVHRGIRYKPDAKTPVSESPQWKARDRVNYPGETLLRGTGDCDDLTVLCCSLLEAVQVRAAVVVGDAHVLLMFDTGIEAPAEDGDDSSAPDGRGPAGLFAPASYIRRDGRIWLPIETTELAGKNGSFVAAWAAAWLRKEAIQSGKMRVVEVREGWKRYKPLHPAPAEGVRELVRELALGKAEGLDDRIQAAIGSLRKHGHERLASGLHQLEEEYEGEALAQAQAFLLAASGLYLDAAGVLARTLFGDEVPADETGVRARAKEMWTDGVPFSAAVLLGDLALDVALASTDRDRLDFAASCLELALSGLPDDLPEKAELMLRLGLIHLQRGELSSHRRWVDRATAKDPTLRDTLIALLTKDGSVSSSRQSPKVRAYFRRGLRLISSDRVR